MRPGAMWRWMKHSCTSRSTSFAALTSPSHTVVSPEKATRAFAVSNRKPKAGSTGRWSTVKALIRKASASQITPSSNSVISSSRPAVEGRHSQAMRCSRSLRQTSMVASAKARVPAGPKTRCGRSRP